jgi:hypothetical protein
MDFTMLSDSKLKELANLPLQELELYSNSTLEDFIYELEIRKIKFPKQLLLLQEKRNKSL